jgi:phenylpropionate dioxygenase-like ring-hydroxylating dioxygenase large terminal subunit
MTSIVGADSGAQIKPLTASQGCQDAALLNDWHVVGFSKDFAPAQLYPLTLLGRDLVAWRDTGGALHVWEDLCVHRGARLSKGSICDDHVICPYHGWRYDTTAQCTLIPSAPREKPMSKARAFSHSVAERYELVWVCIGTPDRDIPIFPEWDDESYIKVFSGPYEFANAFRAIENFLDISHFPFVHSDMNGRTTEPDELKPYQVEMTDMGLRSTEIAVFQPCADARGIPAIANYSYKCFRPLVAHFSKRIQDIRADGSVVEGKDTHLATFCVAQMIDETHCILRACAVLDVKPAPDPEKVRSRADFIFVQDAGIVATQRPERIPTELRQELHHRTDLLGQRYRSWLRSMNIGYGVI